MNISNKAKYGIRIMLYIALESGDTITVQDIFNKEDVSKRYLEQIFAELKKNGLVHSIKGKHGGYFISKSLNDITPLDIIVAIEGEGNIGELPTEGDKELENVLQEQLWGPLQQDIKSLLSSVTLEDLLSDYNQRQANMFYI
jgi:Rrf2 family protein